MKIEFGSLSAKREMAILKKVYRLTQRFSRDSFKDNELMEYLKPPLAYDYKALADLKAYGLITIRSFRNDYAIYTLTEKGKAVAKDLVSK